ncbi:phage tail tube protein [Novosphingobium sp. 9U]|uniref:phage tail tube protein n=1 Tax=Novosphingobium sp. 9U TaxID=2653158 RepID=UPI001F45ED52|nr:phage tail tube protein [Novosphingobium sp. 9U]
MIDITDLDSSAKEKMIGIPDEGQVSFTFNFDPTDTGQTALETARSALAMKTLRITTGTVTRTFTAYILTFEIGASVDQTIPLSVNAEISGSIVKGTAV